MVLVRDNGGIRGRIVIYKYSLGDWVGVSVQGPRYARC